MLKVARKDHLRNTFPLGLLCNTTGRNTKVFPSDSVSAWAACLQSHRRDVQRNHRTPEAQMETHIYPNQSLDSLAPTAAVPLLEYQDKWSPSGGSLKLPRVQPGWWYRKGRCKLFETVCHEAVPSKAAAICDHCMVFSGLLWSFETAGTGIRVVGLAVWLIVLLLKTARATRESNSC